jgi:hypothetical protein
MLVHPLMYFVWTSKQRGGKDQNQGHHNFLTIQYFTSTL